MSEGFAGPRAAVVATLAMVAAAAGCSLPLTFPEAPLHGPATAPRRAYDTDGDSTADYFTFADASGRITRIGYDTTADGAPDDVVDLDALPVELCRHIVIVLDGVPYAILKDVYEAGGLRFCHPPSKVVSVYPSMTDLALADVFRSVRPQGYETVYYDHAAGKLAGGNIDYLSLVNEDWAHRIDYRIDPIMDPFSYLFPGGVFNIELADFRALLAERDRREVIGYFVSTAGLATRDGEAGIRMFLGALDRFLHEQVRDARGLVKVTLLADHGHTLARATRVDFRPYLKAKGWRLVDGLEEPRDVVPVEYGLVTYASFACRSRRALATDVAAHEGVRLATFVEKEAIVVLDSGGGEARIERRPGRYRYAAARGDPLELEPILARLAEAGHVNGDGFVDDRALLVATVDHVYPDPLDRLWRAFHAMVPHVPDVLADMETGSYAGLESRAVWFNKAASTHGDLERNSSVTFLASSIAPTPPLLRIREVGEAISSMTGRPFPSPRTQRGEE